MSAPKGRRRNHKVTIEITDEALLLLQTLCGPPAGYDSVESVVSHIVHGFADGVRRPGSWERGCVIQFFGDDFTERLEVGDAEWMRRPKAKPPTGGGEP